MTLTRLPTLRDMDAINKIIKENVKENPVKAKSLWEHKSADEVTGNYESLLLAFATKGARVDRKVFTQCIMKQYEGPPETFKNWAAIISHALMHCKAKNARMVDGSKLASAVVAVAKAFKNQPGAMECESDYEIEIVEPANVRTVSSAEKLLADAMACFSGDGSGRKLQKHDSVQSVTSSHADKCETPSKRLRTKTTVKATLAI